MTRAMLMHGPHDGSEVPVAMSDGAAPPGLKFRVADRVDYYKQRWGLWDRVREELVFVYDFVGSEAAR